MRLIIIAQSETSTEPAQVIVCVCRNLNQARVLEAIEAGAETAEHVHPRCGVEVNCGCCLDMIDDMIGAARHALSQAAE